MDTNRMNEIQELHTSAMELAEEATLEQGRGNTARAAELYSQAFKQERRAAELVEADVDFEPTRSVLLRSAASLALDCQDARSAEKLIAHALAGDPPEEIACELRDLLEQVTFQRHLEVRGMVLGPREFQMSMEGDAVGFGFAESESFVGRVQDLEKLIYRTAERTLDRPFRDRGRRDKGLAKEVGVFLSVPRAASFAVTFRIGYSRQLSLPNLDLGDAVISDVLDCIEVVGAGREAELERRIPEAAYRRNFLALARRIAPDGKAVRAVGFTARNACGERRVVLRRLQSKITPPEGAISVRAMAQRVTVTGTLKFADSRRENHNVIEVIEQGGSRHRILVPEGMMDDIVRPLWDYEVKVVGYRRKNCVHLEDIQKLNGEQEENLDRTPTEETTT